MTEKEFSSFVDKKIRIHFTDGDVLEGECTYFTQSLDNEPEIASISVKSNRGVLEISQDEVEAIETID